MQKEQAKPVEPQAPITQPASTQEVSKKTSSRQQPSEDKISKALVAASEVAPEEPEIEINNKLKQEDTDHCMSNEEDQPERQQALETPEGDLIKEKQAPSERTTDHKLVNEASKEKTEKSMEKQQSEKVKQEITFNSSQDNLKQVPYEETEAYLEMLKEMEHRKEYNLRKNPINRIPNSYNEKNL